MIFLEALIKSLLRGTKWRGNL